MPKLIIKAQSDNRTTSPPGPYVRDPMTTAAVLSPRDRIRQSVMNDSSATGASGTSMLARPTTGPITANAIKDSKPLPIAEHVISQLKAPQRPIRSAQPPSASVMTSVASASRPTLTIFTRGNNSANTPTPSTSSSSASTATSTAASHQAPTTAPMLPSTIPVPVLSSSQNSAAMWEASLPRRIEKARSHLQLYLLNKAGPNSFTLISGSMNNVMNNSDDTSLATSATMSINGDKEPPAIQSKYRVTIGPQTCSCGRGPLCVHLLFVMIRVLHVKEDDPQLRAKSLCNYQVETLMREYEKRNSKLMRHARRYNRSRSSSRPSLAVAAGQVGASGAGPNLDNPVSQRGKEFATSQEKDEVEESNCTICLLPMRDGEILSLCNSSCHNKFHRNCLTVWFDECRRQREALKCPLCRSVWGNGSVSTEPASSAASVADSAIGSLTQDASSTSTARQLHLNMNQQTPVTGQPADMHLMGSPMTSSLLSNLSAQSPSMSGSNSQSNSFRAKQRRRRIQELEALVAKLLSSSPPPANPEKSEEPALMTAPGSVTCATLLNQLNSSMWDERENGLKQLTHFVVQRIMANQQYTVAIATSGVGLPQGQMCSLATFRLAASVPMLESAFGVVAILLTDSNYKVFVASMRAFREMLAYVACESSTVRNRVQSGMSSVLHRLLQQCGHEMKRRSDLALSMLQELARGQQGALAAGKEISPNSPAVSNMKHVFGFVVREMAHYEMQSLQNSPNAAGRTNGTSASNQIPGAPSSVTPSACQQLSSSTAASILGALRVFEKFLALPELDSQDMKACLECTARLLPLLSTWRVTTPGGGAGGGGGTATVLSPTGIGSGTGAISNSDLVHKAHRVLIPAMQALCERNLLPGPLLHDFVEEHMRPYLAGENRLWRKITRIIAAWEEQTRRRHMSMSTASGASGSGAPGGGYSSRRGSSPRILPPPPGSSFSHMSTLIRITPEPAYDQPHISPEDAVVSSIEPGVQEESVYEQNEESEPAAVGVPPPTRLSMAVGNETGADFQVELRKKKTSSQYGGRSPHMSAVATYLVEDPYDRAFCTTGPQAGPRPASSVATRVSLRASLRNSHASVDELKRGEEQLSQEEQARIREALWHALENSRLQTALPLLPAFDNQPMASQTWWHSVQVDTFPPMEAATQCYEENQQWTRGPLLGKGASCHCYQVRDVHTGTLMAMKEMSLARASTKDSQEVLLAALSEIRIMSRLEHANVTRLLGVVHSAEEQVMRLFVEWMPGGTVAGLLARYGAFTEAITVQYTYQLLNGLRYLHGEHILHRDLKGANLLVNAQGNQLKISDFGSSTLFVDNEHSGVTTSFQGHLLGTVAFMAPELLRGESDYSRASDIWSVGCITIEMLTSRPPWSESQCSNHLALIYTIASSQEPPHIPECTSQPLKDFLQICFNLKPSDRLTTEKLLALPVFAPFQASSRETNKVLVSGKGSV